LCKIRSFPTFGKHPAGLLRRDWEVVWNETREFGAKSESRPNASGSTFDVETVWVGYGSQMRNILHELMRVRGFIAWPRRGNVVYLVVLLQSMS